MKKLTKKIKTFGKAIYWFVFVVLITIAALVVISASDIFGNYKILVVQSSSMQPSIPMGSMVFTKRESDYQKGEVITFYNSGDTRYLITHRIAEIEKLKDGKLYITKGDANEDFDYERVAAGNVIGKVIWALPFIGYAVSFAKTQTGLIFLIVIPATLIVYSELLTIKREIKRLKRKGKRKRTFSKSFFIPKLLGLILIFGLTSIGRSSSSFVDTEKASGSFNAATCFGNPHPCGVESGGEELEVGLLFYLREDEHAVGFVIEGVAGYDSLDYVIEYEHDPGIIEHIEGAIDNSSHLDEYLQEWFILGTCSDFGEVCVYDEGIGEINLTVELIVGGVPVETLHRTITL